MCVIIAIAYTDLKYNETHVGYNGLSVGLMLQSA